MSLVVTCLTCIHPVNPRQIVQFRQNCRDCADLCVQSHLAEYPTHNLEITGFISDSPFGPSESIRRLFGRRTA